MIGHAHNLMPSQSVLAHQLKITLTLIRFAGVFKALKTPKGINGLLFCYRFDIFAVNFSNCDMEVHKALGVFKDPRKPLTVSYFNESDMYVE